MGSPRQLERPTLCDVIRHIEDCSKPVVAAIAGAALGGGLELALACHARIALPTALVGMPEITLGIIPEAGATQRLPRLVGPTLALAMMLDGEPRTASSLGKSGLFDALCPVPQTDAGCDTAALLQNVSLNALVESARDLALGIAGSAKTLPRTCDRLVDRTDVEAVVTRERSNLSRREALQPAYGALLEAVQASAVPFENGLQRERELYLGLAHGTAARAGVH